LVEDGLAPSALLDQEAGDRREGEGPDPGAADGNAGGEGPPLLEVEARGDDGRDVDEAGADATCKEAECGFLGPRFGLGPPPARLQGLPNIP
jgi:hypothetical protein